MAVVKQPGDAEADQRADGCADEVRSCPLPGEVESGCAEIITCREQCDSAACLRACRRDAEDEALDAFDDLFDCQDDNDCEEDDLGCIWDNCPLEAGACGVSRPEE